MAGSLAPCLHTPTTETIIQCPAQTCLSITTAHHSAPVRCGVERRLFPAASAQQFCVLKVVVLSYLFCCVMNQAPYVVPHPLRLTLLLLMSSVHLPGGIWCLRARRVLCTQPHQREARCRARFVHLPARFLFLQLHPMAAGFCLWWMAI